MTLKVELIPCRKWSAAQTNAMFKQVEAALSANEPISSGSGWTAAMAMNICETHGWAYTISHVQGRYALTRQPQWDRQMDVLSAVHNEIEDIIGIPDKAP